MTNPERPLQQLALRADGTLIAEPVPGIERGWETLALFDPAPAQLPGQLHFNTPDKSEKTGSVSMIRTYEITIEQNGRRDASDFVTNQPYRTAEDAARAFVAQNYPGATVLSCEICDEPISGQDSRQGFDGSRAHSACIAIISAD